MEPEKEHGNIEYKLKLVNKTEERINELITQMRYRCNEGGGECIYNIGVADNGTMTGITEKEYNETINNLSKIGLYQNQFYVYVFHSIYNIAPREINKL
jgi:GTPase